MPAKKSFLNQSWTGHIGKYLRIFSVPSSGNPGTLLSGWKKGIEVQFNALLSRSGAPVWHVPEGHGAYLVEILAKRCDDLGGKVILNTRCKQILCDEKGIVNGCQPKTAGRKFIVKTKSVIIATGGYAGDGSF